VEFVIVVPMLVLVVLAVAQVALALYIRSTITSAAAEGARVAALAGGAGSAGVSRTRSILGGTVADGVVESVTAREIVTGGIGVVDIEVHARLPLLGMLGPSTLVVHGHAIAEG
jgi:hypothetical protein